MNNPKTVTFWVKYEKVLLRDYHDNTNIYTYKYDVYDGHFYGNYLFTMMLALEKISLLARSSPTVYVFAVAK